MFGAHRFSSRDAVHMLVSANSCQPAQRLTHQTNVQWRAPGTSLIACREPPGCRQRALPKVSSRREHKPSFSHEFQLILWARGRQQAAHLESPSSYQNFQTQVWEQCPGRKVDVSTIKVRLSIIWRSIGTDEYAGTEVRRVCLRLTASGATTSRTTSCRSKLLKMREYPLKRAVSTVSTVPPETKNTYNVVAPFVPPLELVLLTTFVHRFLQLRYNIQESLSRSNQL